MKPNIPYVTLFPTLLALLAAPSANAVSPGPDAVTGVPEAATETSQSHPTEAKRLTCSNRTLFGTYTYQFEGTRDEGQVLTREAGMEVYDGRGGMSVIATFNSVPGGVASFQTTRLTYVVNPNCTGVLSGSRGPYADIFLAPDGSSFTFVSNVAGQQISGTEHRVSERKVKP